MKKVAYIFVTLLLAAASIWNITKLLPGGSLGYSGTGEALLGIGILVVGFFVLAGFLKDEVSSILLVPVGLLLAFPLIRLFVYLIVEMINFRVEPSVHVRREWIGIAIVYVLILFACIRDPLQEKLEKIWEHRPRRIKTKACIGPDGETYVLPANLYTAENPSAAGIKIKNGLHGVLWNSEGLELEYLHDKSNLRWRCGIYESENFLLNMAQRWEGKSVQRSKQEVLEGVPQEYIDMEKAVHFYEMAAEFAFYQLKAVHTDTDAEHGNRLRLGYSYPVVKGWHGSERELKRMEIICSRLTEIYREGVPGVAPSPEKAEYYEKYFKKYKEAWEKKIKKFIERVYEIYDEHNSKRLSARNAAWERTHPTDASSAEENIASDTQTSFTFPSFIYDEDENPWELMNSGYDNATYYCQKTGETETFYKSDFEFGVPSGFHLR